MCQSITTELDSSETPYDLPFPLVSGKLLSGEEEGLEEDPGRAEGMAGAFSG